MQTHSQGFV